MDSREIFSKEKIDDNELVQAAIKTFKVNQEDILVIHDINEWLKKEKQSIIFEDIGLLNEDDTDEHVGEYYYNIYFEDQEVLNSLQDLKKEINTEVSITA